MKNLKNMNYIENEFNNYIEKIKNLRTLFLEQNKKNKKKLLNKKRKRIEQRKF